MRLLLSRDEGSTFGWARFQSVHAVQHTPGKESAYLVWVSFEKYYSHIGDTLKRRDVDE